MSMRRTYSIFVRVLAILAAIVSGAYTPAAWLYVRHEQSYFPDNPGVFTYKEFWISALLCLYFVAVSVTGSFLLNIRFRRGPGR